MEARVFGVRVVRTTSEVVPPGGWRPHREGYDVEMQALVAAQRRAEERQLVTVVLGDSGGPFRVFETTATTVSDSAQRWPIVRHVCQPPARSQQTWASRRDAALSAIRKHNYEPAEELIREVAGAEVKIVSGEPPNYTAVPKGASTQPGVVNFDPSFPGGGRTVSPAPDRAEQMIPLFPPVFFIGYGALGSPETLRAAVEHEARHVYHEREVIKLIEAWRVDVAKQTTKPRPKKPSDFHAWLEARKQKVPKEIYWFAKARVGKERTERAPAVVGTDAPTHFFADQDIVTALLHHSPPEALRNKNSPESLDLRAALYELIKSYSDVDDSSHKPEKKWQPGPAQKAGLEYLKRVIRAADGDRRQSLRRLLEDLRTTWAPYELGKDWEETKGGYFLKELIKICDAP
jgi:hypothetical protein